MTDSSRSSPFNKYSASTSSYILIGVDPKTVQYLAGHENSKITMDICAKVKYNKTKELISIVKKAFGQAMRTENTKENTGV